jgi:hypothetical protein
VRPADPAGRKGHAMLGASVSRRTLGSLLEDWPRLGRLARRVRGGLAGVQGRLAKAFVPVDVRARLCLARNRARGEACAPFIQASRFADRCMISDSSVAYVPGRTTPLVYCATYRLLIAALVDGTEAESRRRMRGLLDVVLAAQDPSDGLFKDSAVREYNDESVDWWGWRHLTAQALNALCLFDEKARYPLHFSRAVWPSGAVTAWLESYDWELHAPDASNAVMNYGVALQYERDVCGRSEAGHALVELLDWLDSQHDPLTGSWGVHADTPVGRSMAVQTAYHIWVLYLYDGRPIPGLEAAIDICLATKTATGGFGYRLNTSACEDIDSIQPLVWFSSMTDYRKRDVLRALSSARAWVMANQMADGGFVFRIGEPFSYGPAPAFFSGPNRSALFPTWFRALSLAYIERATAFSSGPPGYCSHMSRSPGYQSWSETGPPHACKES